MRMNWRRSTSVEATESMIRRSAGSRQLTTLWRLPDTSRFYGESLSFALFQGRKSIVSFMGMVGGPMA